MGNRIAIIVTLSVLGIGIAHAAEPQAAPQGPRPADLQGDWNGTYQCGQDRLHLLGRPFVWQVPFTIIGGQVTARRPYVDINAQLSVALFAGLIVDQGTGLEIGMIVPRADGEPGLHGTYTGRVTGDLFTATGEMLSRHNRILRQCELHLQRDRPKPT